MSLSQWGGAVGWGGGGAGWRSTTGRGPGGPEMLVVSRWLQHVPWCTLTRSPKLPKPLGSPKGAPGHGIGPWKILATPLGRTRPLKVPRNLFTCPPLPHVAVWRPDGRGPICQARALGAQSSWGRPLLRTPQATPELGTPLVTGSFLSLLYQPVMAHRHSLAPPWPSSHNQVVTCDPCPPAPQLHLWEQSPQLSGGDPP